MSTTHRSALALTAGLALAVSLTACGSGGEGDDGKLLVWSLEVQPDRVAATQAVIDAYTDESGVDVELVPVEEAQIPQLLSAAALAHEMPDVIGALPLGLVRSFDGDGYLDREAAGAVVEALGADTWEASTLDLTRDGDQQLAVPADAWAQILVYRTDLFDAAGLEAPDDYDALLEAAEALTADGRYGISIATDPGDPFTQQTFESLALGNGCELADDTGAVTLDSDACTETIELYGALAGDASPDGTQSVDSTRAAYFSGQAAMTVWSTFLLDELAGLRNDAMPSCPECAEPGWLAEHTGIVPLVTGPSADDAGSYGELTSWAITEDAGDGASGFVEYMLSDGYEGWLAMAPEGKFPARLGTSDAPSAFADAWAKLAMGVDTRAPLGEIYPAETVEAVQGVTADLARWAIPQGQGRLVGPLTAELPIAKIIADLAAGGVDASTAQQQMQDAVQEIADR
ncbi:ABC transporter substrate-binding protein [Agromyces archimandritae]|uniref:Extracellular solute-binding protein n=1 Tax=Agromyces archimandritae TaxID=2781962 RepID=A0A975FL87_9MICO|nr:extracellular solute-binding protein [Agromyces archimandritae]QTX03941.1 extracellular solute-binding protein [Agromyces archimandritae]